MINRVLKVWNNYKYRFVPWLSVQMKDINRSNVTSDSHDKSTVICVHHLNKREDSLISDAELAIFLKKLFSEFTFVNTRCEEERRTAHLKNVDCMYNLLGFTVGKEKSKVAPEAGTGVFVQRGTVKAGSVVALYPGTLYLPSEPLLLASIFNPFIFRCKNGLLIDGNDKRISKSIYKSCHHRDRFKLDTPCCDTSWLTPYSLSPLNVGQFVNNETHRQPHNVVYQECHVLDTIPYDLWKFLPNVWYNPVNNNEGLTLIPLVAVRDIAEGQEILSSYFTVIHE